MKKRTYLYILIIIIIFIGAIIFFVPKTSSIFGSAPDVEFRDCSCFGFESKLMATDGRDMCYGIVHSCRWYKYVLTNGVMQRVEIEKPKEE